MNCDCGQVGVCPACRWSDVFAHAESARIAIVGQINGTAAADLGQAHRDICAILAVVKDVRALAGKRARG